MTAPTIDTPNRERRVRRAARKQGLVLAKSRRSRSYVLTEETPRGTRFILSAGYKAGGLDLIEEELSKPPTILPPDFVADVGTVVKTLVEVPHWLYVLQQGDDAIAVYRSTWLHEDSQMLWPALDIIEGLPLLHREIVEDAHMMHGSAEHSIYAVAV
jgi:hypothetical protein